MDSKRTKVFLYFLSFCADDLKLYYDEEGIAAVAYCGSYEFLNDSDAVTHCFEEGYVTRSYDVAFALYAYTDNDDLARSFESSRNMSIFKSETVRLTDAEFKNLLRFREAELRMESLRYAPKKYMNIVLNNFECSRVMNADEAYIVTEWSNLSDAFELLPMHDGYSFDDDCLEESLMSALDTLNFKYFLGNVDYCPIDPGIELNEWNIFYRYFSNTLCQ